MYKNKNSRTLLIFFLFIFLSGGLSTQDASAITTAGCQSAGGTCKQGASASCDAATENNSGSCMDNGYLSGMCCVPKTPVPGNPTPTGGTVGTTCIGDNGVITGTCQSAGSCTGGGANVDTSASCAQGLICCKTANPASGAGTTPTPNSGTLNYVLLEKIPGFSSLNGADLPAYVLALYKIALVIVTLSAVLMISIGGFMYITSAGNTSSMSTAKGIIFDSIIGLVIALGAWLVLFEINPDLVNVNITSFAPISTTAPPAGPVPPPGTGAAGSCGGLTPQAAVTCADASQALSDILTCMKLKGVNASISSIGDSQGFNQCKNSWSRPPCAHSQTSCHYGGGASKTAPECQKSHAADISVRNLSGAYDVSIANAVKAAASACGARVNDETQIPGVAPHIHISTQTSCCTL